MTPLLQDSRELAKGINAINQQRTARADSAAGLVLAIAIGVALGIVAWLYATPCSDATLCMAAVLPTRRHGLQRLACRWADAFCAWRLRYAIHNAQKELVWQYEALELAHWECDHIPQQLKVTRAHIDQLEAQLSSVTQRQAV